MNSSKGTNLFTVFISGVALLMAAVRLDSYVIASAKQNAKAIVEATTKYRQFAEQVDYVIQYDKLTHWQREKWEVDAFFHSPAGIAACEIISSRDPGMLRSWISGGGDVNLTGDHGVTLLFWVLFDRKMTAFELLLIHDADPDFGLTSTIERMNEKLIFHSDTVIFAAIELKDFDFVVTALPYSDATDQRDYNEKQSSVENKQHAIFIQRPSLVGS